MDTLVSKAIEIAKAQVGVREVGLSNSGQQVDQYLKAAGSTPHEPWCLALDFWCVDQACQTLGVNNPLIKTAYTPACGAWAAERGILYDTPEPGDIVLFRGATRFHHAGFVVDVQGNTFFDVEGNTNSDGSVDGYECLQKIHAIAGNQKFVRWAQLAGDQGETYTLVIGDQQIAMPVVGGKSLCPVRAFGEALGYEVDWDSDNQWPVIGGIAFDQQVSVIDGKTYAPIRDLAAVVGKAIAVDVPNRTVTILVS